MYTKHLPLIIMYIVTICFLGFSANCYFNIQKEIDIKLCQPYDLVKRIDQYLICKDGNEKFVVKVKRDE